MKPNLGYDRELQMFVAPPADFNLEKLRFLRWLAERNLLEHDIAGEPSGFLAALIK